ncbi:helix-turn-helix domain-containing protein [Clostridioides sp. ES-S-0190-01]|uniref:helix-turn-helix domain-containing protein n=1 Tax=Clostridioides sp. ES-S-0190-01 TaxID=2770787 RepID=UPI001D105522|nr:helix-turn-helix transcriptional regulator [Clostridioides sp. ES-S-0190-01]
MAIGEDIKKLRKSKGLTQQELAEKANISKNAIYNYENNKSIPNAKILKKIMNALEVVPDEITIDIKGLEEFFNKINNINSELEDCEKISSFTINKNKMSHFLQEDKYSDEFLKAANIEKSIKIYGIYNKLFNLKSEQLKTINKLVDVLIEENKK